MGRGGDGREGRGRETFFSRKFPRRYPNKDKGRTSDFPRCRYLRCHRGGVSVCPFPASGSPNPPPIDLSIFRSRDVPLRLGRLLTARETKLAPKARLMRDRRGDIAAVNCELLTDLIEGLNRYV